jgi:uncharacterized surface anchored protein
MSEKSLVPAIVIGDVVPTSYKVVEVKVAKETYELSEGVVDFVIECFDALGDGFQMTEDVSKLISAAMTKLIPALEGFDKVDDEYKMDKQAFMSAFMLSMPKLIAKLTQKKKG